MESAHQTGYDDVIVFVHYSLAHDWQYFSKELNTDSSQKMQTHDTKQDKGAVCSQEASANLLPEPCTYDPQESRNKVLAQGLHNILSEKSCEDLAREISISLSQERYTHPAQEQYAESMQQCSGHLQEQYTYQSQEQIMDILLQHSDHA